MALHSTELAIYEVGLSQAPDIFTGQDNGRIGCLWSCLNASKTLVDVFLSIKPADFVGFSQLIYSGILQCIIVIYRLLLFEHAEWDRALAREHLDLSSILEESEKKFAQVAEAAGHRIGSSGDVDAFTFMASRVRYVKISWHAANASAVGLDGVSFNDELFDFPMEFSEEDMQRVLGSWDG